MENFTYTTQAKAMQLRPVDDVDAVEWARYYKAQSITDNRKLAAMLPAYIKRELFKPLPKIVYDFSMKLPHAGLFTIQRDPVRVIPGGDYADSVNATKEKTLKYIAEFNKANGPYVQQAAA